jgi:glycosyltransferase involved in cell wall biosynthesis
MTSVVIIFFDAGAFLEEAIESVLAQTDSGWELLLVDDGSTDQSTSVAQSYVRRFPDRIRHLQHPQHANMGMSASRNLGLRYARGDLLAFLDADDVWFPNKLAQQRELLECQPSAGMLVGRYEIWHSWKNNSSGQDSQCGLRVIPDTLVQPPELALICYPLGVGPAPSMSDLIVRRHVVEQVGGFEDRFRGMYEDQAFLIKMYLSTPIYVSGTCWSKYRKHERSCCSVAKTAGEWEYWRSYYLYWLETYLQTKEVDGAIRAALQKAIWPYRHPLLDLPKRGLTLAMRVLRKIGRITGLTPMLRPFVRLSPHGTTDQK